MSSRCVVLVGHCSIDGPRLQEVLSQGLTDCEVRRVNSTDDLQQACAQGADVLLVNREPVGFDQDGLELIREVRSSHPEQKVLLVSDYDDAQQQARAAGALPGFGKSQIGSPTLCQIVEQALAGNADATSRPA